MSVELPQKQGYAKKSQRNSIGLYTSWKDRFFVLQDGEISYYTEPTKEVMKGSLSLIGCSLKNSNDSTELLIESSIGSQNGLNIKFTTVDECENWKVDIAKHIKHFNFNEKMLKGKTCVVTGSTSGIGKGIARNYLKQGAFVFIGGRSDKTVNKTLEEFRSEGLTNVQGIVADITTTEGCKSFFSKVDESGKFVDVLCNNMGVFDLQNFFEVTDEKWTEYFQTNVLTTVKFCRKFLKPMLEKNSGRVIIISSEGGVKPIPDMIAYSTTKGAQITLARGLAELTKGTNVTVNSLLPGPTMTEGVETFVDGLVAESNGASREDVIKKFFQDREPTSLIQRFLRVEEVANVATFLASDMSSGINGATQRVEGGIIRST